MLAAVLLGACNSSGEPQRTYNLCVHAEGAPFEPGSTGPDCAVTQQLRAGQIRTVELEADMYSGEARSATLAIEFAPNGWTVTLGGTTIPIPGKQTLTMIAPDGALPGNYQIAVKATSGAEQIILTFNITLTSPI
jgi:hypothetical protein